MNVFSVFLTNRGAAAVLLLQAVALVPPVAVTLWLGSQRTVLMAMAAFATVLAWDAIFAALRDRRFAPSGVTTAAIFVVLAPADVSLWQLAVGLSLGTVIGELVFGGRGFGFLNAAAVALALTVLSAPGMALAAPGSAVAWASLPGAAVLLGAGLINWRVPLAFLVVVFSSQGGLTPPEALSILATTVFVLVFVISDPTASAVTGIGRLVQGAVAGVMVWALGSGPEDALRSETLIFAALLASLFAPLLDHAALTLNLRRRAARQRSLARIDHG